MKEAHLTLGTMLSLPEWMKEQRSGSGLSGTEMDPSKGPSVLSVFTNAKYGQIMWLHLVTPGG